MKSIAVFTATTGRDTLWRTCRSIIGQTYPCHHYVISDGISDPAAIENVVLTPGTPTKIWLPEPTGKNGIMNGAVCAMAAYIATEDYLCFCDDDNWFEPEHVESLVACMENTNAAYSYSLRNLYLSSGHVFGKDDGESLGHYGDLVDVNCYLFRRDLAVGIAPLWYRTTGELMIGDRFVWQALQQNQIPWAASGMYTVNYTMGARGKDMRPFHFIKNIQRLAQYGGAKPWSISSKA